MLTFHFHKISIDTGVARVLAVISLAVLLANYSFAEELTLEEAQDFFANTKKIYDEKQGDYYEGVNMHELLEKAGISLKPAKECYLYYPETKLYSGRSLKALRVHGSLLAECQFLLFKKSNDRWVYFDRIDVDNQKYDPPEIEFLEDGLVYVTAYAASGIGTVYYTNTLYAIGDREIRQLLVCPGKGYVLNWGMVFNRDFKSRLDYSGDTLTIEYIISVSANTDYYKPSVDNVPPTFPLFTAARSVVFNRNNQELVLDKRQSQLTLDNLNDLYNGDYVEYYSMFKNEFHQLRQSDEMRQEWHKVFMERVKQRSEINAAPQNRT